MKDKANKEAERLIELYEDIIYGDCISIHSLQHERCIIISIQDVENTIKALDNPCSAENCDCTDYNFYTEVKQILEDKLK